MTEGLPYTSCSESVQTHPKCFIKKNKVLSVEVKIWPKASVSVMELNVNEPLMTCRNGLKSRIKSLVFCYWQDTL